MTSRSQWDGDSILDVLEQKWPGPRSYELERLLRESDFPMDRYVC